jgi:hypothetical protein
MSSTWPGVTVSVPRMYAPRPAGWMLVPYTVAPLPPDAPHASTVMLVMPAGTVQL